MARSRARRQERGCVLLELEVDDFLHEPGHPHFWQLNEQAIDRGVCSELAADLFDWRIGGA